MMGILIALPPYPTTMAPLLSIDKKEMLENCRTLIQMHSQKHTQPKGMFVSQMRNRQTIIEYPPWHRIRTYGLCPSYARHPTAMPCDTTPSP